MLRKIGAYIVFGVAVVATGIPDVILFGMVRIIATVIAKRYAKALLRNGGNMDDVQKVNTVYWFFMKPLIYNPLMYLMVMLCYISNIIMNGKDRETLYDMIAVIEQYVKEEIYDDMMKYLTI